MFWGSLFEWRGRDQGLAGFNRLFTHRKTELLILFSFITIINAKISSFMWIAFFLIEVLGQKHFIIYKFSQKLKRVSQTIKAIYWF